MSIPLFESYVNKLKPNRSQTQLTLSQTIVFNRLSWQELKIVEHAIHVRHYAPGEPIFRQGDPGSGMYIIMEGSVGIYLDIPNQDPKKVSELNEGDFFGEIALLDDSPRSAGAIAMDSCSIIGFFRPDLMDLLKTKPALGSKILLSLSEVLGTRLRSTNAELVKAMRKLEDLERTPDNE